MPTAAAGLPNGDIETITGNENLLILVPSPGDESLACGGLIAAACRRGRPPFVMVLGDGTAGLAGTQAHTADDVARMRERQTRAAVHCLGLDGDRLLMAGLHDGAIPGEGPVFATVVRAVTLVMWRQDCNVICAPWPAPGSSADERASFQIAHAVAAASGVGLLAYAGGDAAPEPDAIQGWRLDIKPYQAAKQMALEAAGAALPTATSHHETYLRPAG